MVVVNTQSAIQISQHIVNHFEWYHLGEQGDSKSPIGKDIENICNIVVSAVPADVLAPLSAWITERLPC